MSVFRLNKLTGGSALGSGDSLGGLPSELVRPETTSLKDMTHASSQYDTIQSSNQYDITQSTTGKPTKVSSNVEGVR